MTRETKSAQCVVYKTLAINWRREFYLIQDVRRLPREIVVNVVFEGIDYHLILPLSCDSAQDLGYPLAFVRRTRIADLRGT